MDHVAQALDALIDVVVETVVAGFDAQDDSHEDTRKLGRDMSIGAATQALLGPKLGALARALTGEVSRRTELRYAAYIRSPFYSQEQIITEAERAEVTFLNTLGRVSTRPDTWEVFDFTRASIRLSAITAAMGAACIIPPKDPARVGRAGLRQRRREISAVDIPAEVAELILATAADNGDIDAAITGLRALEQTELNHSSLGLITKLLALIEHEDGQHHLNTIATRLRRAQFGRVADGKPVKSHGEETGDLISDALKAPPLVPQVSASAPAVLTQSVAPPSIVPPPPAEMGRGPSLGSRLSAMHRASKAPEQAFADHLRASQRDHVAGKS